MERALRRWIGEIANHLVKMSNQLEEEWRTISLSTMNDFIDSMPRRCIAAIDDRGSQQTTKTVSSYCVMGCLVACLARFVVCEL